MKSFLFFLLTLGGLSTILAQSFLQDSLSHDGETRKFSIFLPTEYSPEQSFPLIINMHGLGSNSLEQFLYSEMTALADSLGYIIVYPQGLEAEFLGQVTTHWNASFGTGVDDLGFIDKLIDRIYTDYFIDLSRVYATGMSNGAYMAYHLACQLSDRIAAVASVTGSMSFSEIGNCGADRPIAVMQIHGTADPTVAFNGTPFFSPSIPDVVNFWLTQNNCSTYPDTIAIPDIDPNDATTATLYQYRNCDGDTEVHFYVVDNGGHSWPGAQSVPSLDPTNQDFEATEKIIEFFSQHVHPDPAPGTILSIFSPDRQDPDLQSFPNPFSEAIQISLSERASQQVRQLSITDLHGRILWQSNQLSSQQLIQVNSLSWPSGIYFLHATTSSNQIVSKKLVKLSQ